MYNFTYHRDYSSGVPIQIKVFPNEVIIYNDGQLPENWTVADLLARHRSMPHNPHIANAFFRSGQIETWGRGIEKIGKACKEAGKPSPVFEATTTEIKVTFSTPVSDATVGEKVGENVGEKPSLNDTQQKIVDLMSATPEITAKLLAEAIGITPRRVEDNISKLKNAGLIERTGSDRKGTWTVKI
jgi:ATP-dependent DNA helicase RecG